MKVEAKITKVEYEEVEIDPAEVIQKLKNKWISESKIKGDYINAEGIWESWIDTHGSGIYKEYEKATDLEKLIYESFDIVLSVCRNKI